jgi:hypothetical protein
VYLGGRKYSRVIWRSRTNDSGERVDDRRASDLAPVLRVNLPCRRFGWVVSNDPICDRGYRRPLIHQFYQDWPPGWSCSHVAAAIIGLVHPTRYWQIFPAEEVRIEELGLVSLATIREDGDDGIAWAKIACEPHGSHDIDCA